jgi:hypothetical protein
MAESPGGRIPVHAVSGAASGAIADRVELEPRSLGLVRMRTRELPNLLPLPPGCPCCTGRVALEISLARHVRERRPERIYIEIAEPLHAAQLAAVLAREPLCRYLEDAGEAFLAAQGGDRE